MHQDNPLMRTVFIHELFNCALIQSLISKTVLKKEQIAHLQFIRLYLLHTLN